ncbi:hypothetical protein BDV33DRAFT_139117 [Aspergillus novoparasiticus]|uniref:Uncharacterized protein n=1 Tax=Aspergillus novoparasiticus TaxID=986946 RepID=A0A5N6EKD0_9EURO|nr:hypothetical protein BDV33DRAFT_139117 [Aspergillus novoparasiticus]
MADGLKRHSYININPLLYGCVTTLNSAYLYRMRAYFDYKVQDYMVLVKGLQIKLESYRAYAQYDVDSGR